MNKIDIKSLLIGFLSCVVLVLIVGFKSIEPSSAGVGTYQAFGEGSKFMINTINGELYIYSYKKSKHIWLKLSPEKDYIVE